MENITKEDIIKDYIEHIRSLSQLSDDVLRNIISESVEKDPIQLDAIERISYKIEKIDLTTLTYAQSIEYTEDKDEIEHTVIGNEINIYIENGCLSTNELKKLTQCIREIEQNNTDRIIRIWIDTPEKTIEEMEDVINSANPEFPHKFVIKSPSLHQESKEKDWENF